MNSVTRILCAAALLGGGFLGCEKAAGEAKVQVEKLPEVKPSLPGVPTLPPPPHPTQYADQSFTVYGLRKQLRKTIDTDVQVTGYIAKVFVPPECPPKQKCPLPPAPHMWLADTQGEADEAKLLLVAGYAENQAMIDEAIENDKKGKKPTEEEQKEIEEMGILPIPIDFFPGAKVKVKGRFAYISGSGFQSSEGVLGYAGHETLEPAPEAAAAK
jgi:hypothetical protein